MRVLHVIPSVSPKRGGPSKAVIEMVAELRRQQIEAEIATTNDDGDLELSIPLHKEHDTVTTDFQGVPVRFFARYSPQLSQVREFSYSSSFRRWLNANIHHYDLLHIHAIFSFTSSYAMWLARRRQVPYIVRPIGQLEHWSLNQSKIKKRAFLALFDRKSLALASAIQFTADSEQQQATSAFPELTELGHVIPLGVKSLPRANDSRLNLCKHHNVSPDSTLILFLSRLHPKKGLELLMQALREINGKAWSLLIAGDGQPEYLASLRTHARDLGIESQCHFLGFQSGADKSTLLAGADVFALTSYSENFGIAALEALAHGTRVLVSEEVGLSDFVAEHQLGWVCKLDQASIVHALNQSLNPNQPDSDRVRSTTVQHYGWNKIAQKLMKLYRDVAKTT